ncbi:MAG: DUF6596 domain-containing protein [Ornithinimicrobium sp.]
MERAWREHWGRIVAILVSRFRRLDLAEDAAADAFATATGHWRHHGVPDRPGAWLLTAARRRVLDRLKAEAMAARKEPLLVVEAHHTAQNRAARADPGDLVSDERLRLVLLCTHPALSVEASTALALRLVVGLSTADIGRLVLQSESAVAARITRAKRKITAAGMPFALPSVQHLPARVDRVADVAYLAFTAGYVPGPGPEPLRILLAAEAIRLLRVTRDLTGPSTLLDASLGLMLLHHARRDTRVDPHTQRLILLPDQDRGRWHQDEIVEALQLLTPHTAEHGPQAAQTRLLEALIAAEHAIASRAEDTRWDRIAAHYASLEALTGSPVVRLNRAVAVSEVEGPEAGLALLRDLDPVLKGSHRLPAVRGALLRRTGDLGAAREAYTRAVALCQNEIERRYLIEQLDSLSDGT